MKRDNLSQTVEDFKNNIRKKYDIIKNPQGVYLDTLITEEIKRRNLLLKWLSTIGMAELEEDHLGGFHRKKLVAKDVVMKTKFGYTDDEVLIYEAIFLLFC